MTGPAAFTPEVLQRFDRWLRAFEVAVERAKARGDWNTCPCPTCVARRCVAVRKEMPEEFRA